MESTFRGFGLVRGFLVDRIVNIIEVIPNMKPIEASFERSWAPFLILAIAAFVLLDGGAGRALAQRSTASIAGSVVDASESAAPGARVVLESGAGVRAQFPDGLYKKGEWAGSSAVLSQADVLLTVAPLSLEQIGQLKPGAVVVGFLQAHARQAEVKALRDRRITSFADFRSGSFSQLSSPRNV